MAASVYTLSTLRDMVEATLINSSNVSWAAGDIDAAIRLALDEISRVNGSALALNGLNSAAATTLDALDEKTLVEGSCMFAALARMADRAEKPSVGGDPADGLLAYARVMRTIFEARLRAMKRRLLARATSAPASAWAWAEDEENTFE